MQVSSFWGPVRCILKRKSERYDWRCYSMNCPENQLIKAYRINTKCFIILTSFETSILQKPNRFCDKLNYYDLELLVVFKGALWFAAQTPNILCYVLNILFLLFWLVHSTPVINSYSESPHMEMHAPTVTELKKGFKYPIVQDLMKSNKITTS